MPTVTWNNSPPLDITAKVDALINPTDYLEWESSFMTALIPDPWAGENTLPFDGVNSTCTSGDQYLAPGLWRFTVTAGICNAEHPIALFMNPDQPDQTLLATLSHIDAVIDVTIPLPNDQLVRLLQNGAVAAATVMMQRISYFSDSGSPPNLIPNGDTLTARWNYTPTLGVLTATAHVYDGNGFLLASSDPITLTITDSDNGGE